MNKIFHFFILLIFVGLVQTATAQKIISVKIPDMDIKATKILKGDGDTYGLGDWQCITQLELVDSILHIKGQIVFREKANDFTTIVGKFHKKLILKSLRDYRNCEITLEKTEGFVGGNNAGATGFQKYLGKGVIQYADIVSDTMGNDVGNIGGKIKFKPIKIQIKWLYAAL